MPLYRFYRITSTEGPEEYIGSTIYTIERRFTGHKANYKGGRWVASCILFAKYGVETCSITLISEQEMEKVDARREERRLIEECLLAVNRCRPIVEEEERRQEQSKYYRKYAEVHRQECNEHKRKYREEHREAINAKNQEKIPCDVCGKLSMRANITRHKKSCVPPQQ
jgi:hypothetical protein